VTEIEPVELAIDTAAPIASVAVARRGALLAEITWRVRGSHESECLAAIEAVLTRAAVEREAIAAIFIDRGPGSYAGLRVGAGIAMGLAMALDTDLLGVGRLDIDAYPWAAFPGPVCAVHQAGRGDIAWAVFEGQGVQRRTVVAPRLDPLAVMLDAAPAEALICGDLEGIEEEVQRWNRAQLALGVASLRRAGALAELGWQRYEAGARDDPRALEPLYLREPSITRAKQARP
jgi:tRNA threonylcarbamoyladenosine biosynthesis protein TsaB